MAQSMDLDLPWSDDHTFGEMNSGIEIPRLTLNPGQQKRYRLLVPVQRSPGILVHEFRNEDLKWFRSGNCWNNPNGPYRCPICRMGRNPRSKVLLIFWAYEGEPEPRVELWERARGFVRRGIDPIQQAGIELTQTDVLISRQGQGVLTNYHLLPVPKDPRFTLPSKEVLQQQIAAIRWDAILNTFPSAEDWQDWLAMERGEVAFPPKEDDLGVTPPQAPEVPADLYSGMAE